MIKLTSNGSLAILHFETQKGNSFNLEDILELQTLLNSIESDARIKGIILTGNGASFCTGGNVEYIKSLKNIDEVNLFFRSIDETLLKIFSFQKPVCSAINGHAIGFGFLMMYASDFVIASESDKCKFGLPEINIGMTIDPLMIQLLEFNGLNRSELAKMIYAGSLFNITKLSQFFKIDKITNQSSIVEESIDILNRFTNNLFNSFVMNKKNIKKTYINTMIESLHNMDYKIFLECLDIKNHD